MTSNPFVRLIKGIGNFVGLRKKSSSKENHYYSTLEDPDNPYAEIEENGPIYSSYTSPPVPESQRPSRTNSISNVSQNSVIDSDYASIDDVLSKDDPDYREVEDPYASIDDLKQETQREINQRILEETYGPGSTEIIDGTTTITKEVSERRGEVIAREKKEMKQNKQKELDEIYGTKDEQKSF